MHRPLIAALLFAITTACYRSPCDMPVFGFDSGTTKVTESFSSPEGGFKIGLPATRRGSGDGQKGPEGATRFKWLVLNNGSYEVAFLDLNRDIETLGESQALFDKLRDTYLAKAPSTLELDKELMLSGHPGREIRIRTDSGLNIQRLYAVKFRLYIIAAFIPGKLNCAVDSVVKTLDTFEFTGENSAA
jgi:hypothetical protein